MRNALRETADALAIAERSGDEFALLFAQLARGITLIHGDPAGREAGFALLAVAREATLRGRFTMTAVPCIDLHSAREQAKSGDLDGAIESARSIAENMFDSGSIWSTFATACLVEGSLVAPRRRWRHRGHAGRDRPVGCRADLIWSRAQ